MLFDGGGDTPGHLSLSGPFMLAVAFTGWTFVGFESAGSIAKRFTNRAATYPKAVILSLTFIALVVMYASLAIILAMPNIGAVTSGEVIDPVSDTLTSHSARASRGPLRPFSSSVSWPASWRCRLRRRG